MTDFDVEFFYGENEENLMACTLNDISEEQIPKLLRALNSYLRENQLPLAESIELSADDGKISLVNGGHIPICPETTFSDMLRLISGDID